MPAKFTELVIDCADTERMATFWASVLGYEVLDRGSDGEIEIGPGDRSQPTLVFVRVPEGKTVKNRLHIDVNPAGTDQATELQRLLGLGARQIDIGQGEVSWIVLVDPEDNEFCLLRRDVG
jgi:catechol-2,3-dioxygenase